MPWFLLALVLAGQDAGSLVARIRAIIAGPPSGEFQTAPKAAPDVAVVYARLDGAAATALSPDTAFHAASTMKVPVMIELFRQAEAGQLTLDEQLPVKNEFHSIVDGSVYQMDVSDDSDSEVYKAVGRTMSLRALCEAMITVSSNFAANLLIERVGAKNVQATVDKLGGSGVRVLRGVEDQKAFDKGLNNVTTARGLATLLRRLATGTAVSAKADAAMIEILKRQTFNDAIPAGVPAGVAVAHKTGTITRIHHDAGIVYGPHPYVLVVLVRGIEDQKASAALIAAISREVWQDASR
jgi:beta-lactamase class A